MTRAPREPRFWVRAGAYPQLVALIVVFGILAISAALVAPRVIGAQNTAKEHAAAAELSALQSAVSLFYAENGYYPTGLSNQPTSADAMEICYGDSHNTANCGGGSGDVSNTFVGTYIHQPPTSSAGDFYLVNSNSEYTTDATVFYGLTVNGNVFMTQSAPSSTGEWSTSTSPPDVITLETVNILGSWPGNGSGTSAYTALTSTM